MPTASMKDLKNNKLDKDCKSWWLASKRFACVFQFFRFYWAIDCSLLLITQQVCYREKNHLLPRLICLSEKCLCKNLTLLCSARLTCSHLVPFIFLYFLCVFFEEGNVVLKFWHFSSNLLVWVPYIYRNKSIPFHTFVSNS